MDKTKVNLGKAKVVLDRSILKHNSHKVIEGTWSTCCTTKARSIATSTRKRHVSCPATARSRMANTTPVQPSESSIKRKD